MGMTAGRRSMAIAVSSLVIVGCAPGAGRPAVPTAPAGVAGLLVVTDDPLDLPYSVTCNVQVEGPVLHTAAHCLEANSGFVAVGGDSMCDGRSWSVRPVAPDAWTRGGDVARATTERPRSDEGSSGDGGPREPSSGQVTVEGFGRTDGSGSTACHLQAFTAEVVRLDECSELIEGIDAPGGRWLCLDGPVLCPGFSGSGVFADGQLIGVVSAGDTCEDPAGRTLVAQIDGLP